MTFHPASAIFVLPAMLLMLEVGRRFRILHKSPAESGAIESAIFALFGLLLAFTFSGAVSRYDTHRQLNLEESNDIGTAYLRLDLLPITATRQNAFNMHPPAIVFFLLFAFSCGSAFLAGYSMTARNHSWFYMIALAIAVTATIYATLEIEYPRRGLIRFTDIDQSLIDLRNSMK